MDSYTRAGLHEIPVVELDLNDHETLEVAIVEIYKRGFKYY